jgi:predicted transcriptional regulator
MMNKFKIQGHQALREEMKAVAGGEKPAPEDAAVPSFDTVEALIRLLTPENRELSRLSVTGSRNQSTSWRRCPAARRPT